MTETESEQNVARIKKATMDLAEHFDSVQIFATRHESDDAGTIRYQCGSGNWYARFGQVVEYVEREKRSEESDGD